METDSAAPDLTVPDGAARAPRIVATPPAQSIAALGAFIAELLERYEAFGRDLGSSGPAPLRAMQSGTGDGRAAVEPVCTQLRLAAATVRHLTFPPGSPGRPLHIAVLGPTQTGKSTIVNALLDCDAAQVSPLAGFTVHAHGFAAAPAGRVRASESTEPRAPASGLAGVAAPDFAPGWRRVAQRDLSRDRLAEFAFEQVPPGPIVRALGTPAVIWDSPDFDSLAAGEYQQAVLEVAALADLYVLVVSKEKYSDLAVWRMLALLEPLGRPLIACLNKMTADARESVPASLRQRFDTLGRGWGDVPIVTLDYHATGAGADAWREPCAALREAVIAAARAPIAVGEALPEITSANNELRVASNEFSSTRAVGVRRFIEQHWDSWVAPLRCEYTAERQWRELVQQSGAALLEDYRRDYLEHPQRYDAFRRATFELLQLLELPGLSRALTQVRQIVTWPARKALALGKTWWSQRSARSTHALSNEEAVLLDVADARLTGLARTVAHRCDPTTPAAGVWRAVRQRLEAHEAGLRERLRAIARELQSQIRGEIQAAARELYELLQQRPAVLNTLRATRATTDVAAIALAIKTGGMHLNDLLFAPAMLAVASLLTEGALGSYMNRVAGKLKQRQYENVRAAVVESVWVRTLADLDQNLSGAGVFAISNDALAAAEAAWRRLA